MLRFVISRRVRSLTKPTSDGSTAVNTGGDVEWTSEQAGDNTCRSNATEDLGDEEQYGACVGQGSDEKHSQSHGRVE